MQGKNKPLFSRLLETTLTRALRQQQSCLILGPRQSGKTTLVKKALAGRASVLEYPLQNPAVRQGLEIDPEKIIREVRAFKKNPTVFIDEAQKVTTVFDAAQYLIDEHRANFILTGSSARQLRRRGANLLPGRIRHFYLDPLLWAELGYLRGATIQPLAVKNINPLSTYTFFDSLVYGTLPRVAQLPRGERAAYLRSYAELYLEEEIRAEALSRNLGAFARFLELAGAESGTAPNLSKLSQETGVSQPAIKEFYRVLEDTLIAIRVDPYIKNARKRILSSSRYYLFDLGVRNAVARLPLTPRLINAQKGILFEHAVVLELVRRVRALNKNYRICYWRTSGGAEVDCVVDMGARLIPIEIKASERVKLSELTGLKHFLLDYKKYARHGYVITLGNRPEQLAENITAVPWNYL
ncbi:MAG: ATP-binding protein [Candidatus Magasanikbacteria bacterium]|nr:ATP-binding protein [Candidatus Magasanikbacteria bacterium]